MRHGSVHGVSGRGGRSVAQPNVSDCVRTKYAGAHAMTRSFDVLVVGAGPAGIAAAVCAAEEGREVALVDENPRPGGQIWRSGTENVEHGKAVGDAEVWMRRLDRTSVQTFLGWHIFDAPAPKVLRAASGSEVAELHFKSLIIATGARERSFAFSWMDSAERARRWRVTGAGQSGIANPRQTCGCCWNRSVADCGGCLSATKRR